MKVKKEIIHRAPAVKYVIEVTEEEATALLHFPCVSSGFKSCVLPGGYSSLVDAFIDLYTQLREAGAKT